MKHRLKLVLAAVVMLFVWVPAHADSLTFILNNPNQTAAPGSTVTFNATVTAPAGNSGTLYVNGDNIDYFGPGTVDDSSFYNTFYNTTFSPGTTETDNFFSILLPANAPLGTYLGNLQIYGGTDPFAMNLLASANFTLNITNPPPNAIAPEPNSLLLLATATLAFFAFTRNRYFALLYLR